MRDPRRSGFAMLAALMMMALLAIIAIAILSMSAADRRRAARLTRSEYREGCAYSGLTYARNYFANRSTNWNNFLAAPSQLNPMNLPTPTSPAWGGAKANLSAAGIAAIKLVNVPPIVGADLFLDFDGDGASDVYIFMRDNADEFPPASPNFQKDNDQNVIVGAVCISNTMMPKREDGSIDTDRVVMESLLAYNQLSSDRIESDGNANTSAAN